MHGGTSIELSFSSYWKVLEFGIFCFGEKAREVILDGDRRRLEELEVDLLSKFEAFDAFSVPFVAFFFFCFSFVPFPGPFFPLEFTFFASLSFADFRSAGFEILRKPCRSPKQRV